MCITAACPEDDFAGRDDLAGSTLARDERANQIPEGATDAPRVVDTSDACTAGAAGTPPAA